jgi:hypothetical protein
MIYDDDEHCNNLLHPFQNIRKNESTKINVFDSVWQVMTGISTVFLVLLLVVK